MLLHLQSAYPLLELEQLFLQLNLGLHVARVLRLALFRDQGFFFKIKYTYVLLFSGVILE